MDPLVVFFGLGVGILVGLTGIGGGSLMTPLLILVLGIKPVVAIGTDLLYAAITKTLGGWRHWRAGNVHAPICAWMATGSIPGALGGVYFIEWLTRHYGEGFNQLVLIMLASALLFTGAATLIRTLFFAHLVARERDELVMETRHKVGAAILGVSVGFVLGVTSAGSGSLIAVGLIIFFQLTPRKVVGTDVSHAAVVLWAAALAHIAGGNVDYGLTANLLIGSLPGVWLGSHLSGKVSVEMLRPLLSAVLVAAGLALAIKAGLPLPNWAPLPAVPVIMALAVAVQRRSPNPPAPPPPAH